MFVGVYNDGKDIRKIVCQRPLFLPISKNICQHFNPVTFEIEIKTVYKQIHAGSREDGNEM